MRSDPNTSDCRPSATALAVGEAIARLHSLVALIRPDGSVAWISAELRRLLRSEASAQPAFATLLGVGQERGLHALLASDRSGTPLVLRDSAGEPMPIRATEIRLDAMDATASAVVFELMTAREVSHEIGLARTLLAHVATPAAILSDDGFVLTMNAPFAAGLGIGPEEEVAARPIAAWLSQLADLERATRLLRECDENARATLTLRSRDGHARCAFARALAIDDRGARGNRALLLEWADERRHAALAPPLSAFAHDLRSPLAAVLGFARLAREDLLDGSLSRAQQLVGRIERSARTIETMISAALQSAPAASVVADPHEVLEQIRGEIKARLDAGGIGLALPDDPPLLACDRIQLYRLLSNLICNAIEHMGSPPEPEIRVEIECAGDVARVCVRDNGAGIDRIHHERIFQPAHSGATASASHAENCGLGLAIVREIAWGWQGRSWVESRPGQGAAFFVTVPLAR